MRTLADAGHRVTVASPIPPKNADEVYEFIDTRIDKSKITIGSNVTWSYMDTKRMSWAQILILMSEMNEQNCKHVLDMREIRVK